MDLAGTKTVLEVLVQGPEVNPTAGLEELRLQALGIVEGVHLVVPARLVDSAYLLIDRHCEVAVNVL